MQGSVDDIISVSIYMDKFAASNYDAPHSISVMSS